MEQQVGRPTVDETAMLREWFRAVDQDNSGAIEKMELKLALKAGGNGDDYPMESIQQMMDMFDKDHNGAIDFEEFAALFHYIRKVRDSFEEHDRDHNKRLDAYEMPHALRGAGYDFRQETAYQLILKFKSSSSGNRAIWSWKDDKGGFTDYDEETSRIIETASTQGKTRITLNHGFFRGNYEIDLYAKTQKKKGTGYIRPLRRRGGGGASASYGEDMLPFTQFLQLCMWIGHFQTRMEKDHDFMRRGNYSTLEDVVMRNLWS